MDITKKEVSDEEKERKKAKINVNGSKSCQY